jgi:hypothetical protein
MQERLNKNIQQNIFPYWRSHQSLKGKPLFPNGYNRLVFNELPVDNHKPPAQEALA